MRRLPPLPALVTFESVARRGSVTAAARDLGMTPGAVSKQVLKLERWLGAGLFRRSGRGLALTETASRLLTRIGPALDQIETAAREANQQPGDRLRISAPPTFMSHWLVPRLGRFQAREPGIVIQLDNRRDDASDLPDQADLAVRRGVAGARGLDAEAFMPEALTPAHGPVMPGSAAILGPADLAHVTWLTATMRPHDWRRWLEAVGVSGLRPAREVIFDHTNLALRAAMDGLGVAMAPVCLVDGEVCAGRLVLPFPRLTAATESYYAICRQGEGQRHAIRAFRDWLRDEASGHGGALSIRAMPETG